MSWSKVTFAALLGLALACKGGDRQQYTEGDGNESVDGQRGEESGLGTGGGGAGVSAARRPAGVAPTPEMEIVMPDTAAPPVASGQGRATPLDAAGGMIIRTGNATIKVDSLEPAVARLRALALTVGGFVGNTSVQTGRDQVRTATVEIKVPAARWTQLLTGLKPIGVLEAQYEGAQDVGEEYVDAQARVANSRRLEERLVVLLATRTGKLQDVLQVERELARVREQIERYEGRMRYLRTRASLSTMTVTVHEPPPVLGSQPGQNPIADAFRNAWQLFVGLVAFVIASLGVIVPIAIIVAGLMWWRRRPRKVE